MNGLARAVRLALMLTACGLSARAAVAPQPEYKSSADQYAAMKAAAHGGTRHTAATLPDWSGLWTRNARGIGFDAAAPANRKLPGGYSAFTGVLTPEYQPKYDAFIDEVAKGHEYDQLTDCLPSGWPRWLTTPFLREFIVTPNEVWGILEVQSETRRIYTDGRGHVPDDEAYPLWDGDSIGFWDGDTLVVHTNRVKSGRYTRGQPEVTEQNSTVERIRKISPDQIRDEVWVYDPPVLAKPWRVVFDYVRVKDPPDLRLDMWSCEENNNVVRTPDGGSVHVLPGEPGYRDPDKRGG